MKQEDGCFVWEVTLTKKDASEKFGFTQSGKAPLEVLVVRKINEGSLMGEWNKDHPEAEVRVNDRIYRVNSADTVEAMQTELRLSSSVTLRVVRYPSTFEIELDKGGMKLGFKFEKPMNASLQELRITELLEKGALP